MDAKKSPTLSCPKIRQGISLAIPITRWVGAPRIRARSRSRIARCPKKTYWARKALASTNSCTSLPWRIAIAALSVGLAQACYDESLKYARERQQFNRPIATFQAIQFKLADMAMEIELARLMYYKAAWHHMQGEPFTKEASMAKLYASETAKRAADQAVQIHGGYGFMDEYPVSRYWRNVKAHEIGEGTSEVQRQIIAKHL